MSRYFLVWVFCTSFLRMGYSQNLSDSLFAIISLEKRDSAHVYALAKLSQMHRGKDNDLAMRYARQILELSHVNPSQTAKAYVTIGLIHADRAVYDSALLYIQRAELIASKYRDDKNLWSVIYNALGLFYKKQGDNEKALANYKLVDDLGEAELGKENVAGNHINISNLYGRMGNRREAIRYLFKALPVFESLNNSKGMSYCYNNLGVLIKQQGDLPEAEKYLLKSLMLKEKEGDLKGLVNSCNELALLYMDKNDFEKSIAYSDRAITMSEKLGLQESLLTALINKGKMLRIRGDLDEAEAHFRRARPMTKDLPNHFMLAALESESGKLYAVRNDNKKAIETLLSSIEEARVSSNVDAQMNAHLFLSQAYTADNQPADALLHYQKFHYLKDSIDNYQIKLDYKTLETQYEVEKKNAEIALLKKDQELQAQIAQRQRAVNIGFLVGLISVVVIAGILINRHRVISRAKRQLEVERVRNSIARDLHDDIGSTMSSINIVSQMALQKTHERSGEHFQKIADQSAALMERMSDIVWSIHPANDSLVMIASRIKEFTAEILEPKNIRYFFHGFDSLNGERLEVDQRKNLFLICKEAVNNAAKYSDATSVDVSLMQTGKNLVLQVKDDGKGFDATTSKRGNGLSNMEARATAMGANVDIRSSPAHGTTVRVELDLT